MRKITHAAKVEYGNNGTLMIGRKLTEKEVEELDLMTLENVEWLMGFDPYTHVVAIEHDASKKYAVGAGGGHE